MRTKYARTSLASVAKWVCLVSAEFGLVGLSTNTQKIIRMIVLLWCSCRAQLHPPFLPSLLHDYTNLVTTPHSDDSPFEGAPFT